MDAEQIRSDVEHRWDQSILPTLEEYIRIPNQSPLYDPQWKKNGYMNAAVDLARKWTEEQQVAGMRLEVLESEGRTPLIYIEVDGHESSTVLMYGHLDKQPAMVGWEKGLGPWTPVLRDGKLYGRGGADDGYAIFASIAAIRAVQKQGAKHSRIVVIIECCEESGSTDLPHYIEKLAKRIGTPRLIVCLDSGCGNYEQLWLTTSLRGSMVGNLTIEILDEGVHSGDASGIVPSSFRILRVLLERLEEAESGRIKPEWLWVDIPPNRVSGAAETARILGDEVWDKFPWVKGARPVTKDPVELL
ncbi:MAG: M20/M25/M40 family metallo-hydrolase, partial [Thermoanaerobaculia bacterium]